MDMKKAFDYVSRLKLAQQMRQLKIENYQISWMQSLQTNRKIEMVIGRHENLERDVKTSISQDLLVLPILFLIYISRVFNTITTTSLSVTSISFIDDLKFQVIGNSIIKSLLA